MKSLFDLLSDKQKPKEFVSWDKPIDNQKLIDQNEQEQQARQQVQETYNKAYQDGLKQAQIEVDEKKKLLVDLLTLLQKPMALIDEQLEQELLNTLLWFCKECTRIELEQSPKKLLSVLQQIKQHLPMMQGETKIALSHEDSRDLKQILTVDEDVYLLDTFIEDDGLSRGEFRLISDSSEIDGRFEARLSSILQNTLNQ